MSKRERQHYPIDIVDMAEQHIGQVARLHMTCFPQKLETLLGAACVEDCLRSRVLSDERDMYTRVAVLQSTGQVVGYCHSESLAHGLSAHAFLSGRIARRHLFRSGWYRPRVWSFLAGYFIRKFKKSPANEAATISYQPHWEVAKMLGVSPETRGGNVGLDLMLDNEEQVRNRGADRVCGLIERNNIKAEKLYASIGWVRTSPETDQYDVFAMHKDLKP